MRDLVDVDWLAEHLHDRGLVVVDASIAMFGVQGDGIPGAVRFDIDGPFSSHDGDGAHTMPAPDAFERALRAIGVREGDRVVAYDATGLVSSARAWWMLRAAGIDAAVLDGGLPAWEAAGLPTEPVRASTGRPGDVVVRWREGAFVDARAVDDALAEGCAVLDARSAARFAGETPEPRPGVRSGHIPGARSLPFSELAPQGRMLPVAALAARLDEATGDAPIVASCGSGVTASVIALAATLAGREAAVYDGSWAEWGAEHSGRPVATGPA